VLCILVCSLTAFAQKTVSGRVIDVSGEAVVVANVGEKGTTNGIITDVDGHRLVGQLKVDAVYGRRVNAFANKLFRIHLQKRRFPGTADPRYHLYQVEVPETV
jgi:hypothetical protein